MSSQLSIKHSLFLALKIAKRQINSEYRRALLRAKLSASKLIIILSPDQVSLYLYYLSFPFVTKFVDFARRKASVCQAFELFSVRLIFKPQIFAKKKKCFFFSFSRLELKKIPAGKTMVDFPLGARPHGFIFRSPRIFHFRDSPSYRWRKFFIMHKTRGETPQTRGLALIPYHSFLTFH